MYNILINYKQTKYKSTNLHELYNSKKERITIKYKQKKERKKNNQKSYSKVSWLEL